MYILGKSWYIGKDAHLAFFLEQPFYTTSTGDWYCNLKTQKKSQNVHKFYRYFAKRVMFRITETLRLT